MLVQGHAVDQSGLEAALLSLQAQAEKAFKGNMMPRGVFTSGFLNRDGEHVTYIHVPVDNGNFSCLFAACGFLASITRPASLPTCHSLPSRC